MQRKERGNLFWLRVMTWISLTFGRRLSRIVVYGIALYFFVAVRPARTASSNFLCRCLQRKATWRDIYRHFLSFSSMVHDRIYLINDQYGLFDIHTTGLDTLHSMQLTGRGFLLFGAHLGSFEVMRALARENPNVRVCMAMYPENARQINDTLAAINPKAMQDIIPLGRLDSILAIHQRLEEGAMIGILADRAAGPDHYLGIPFLGEPARFPSGPFRLAAMLRQPVFFMTGLYRGGNRYDIHFELLADFTEGYAGGREAAVQHLLEKYVAALEKHCRTAAFNWFNFYDFWDPRTADEKQH
jgi:predicted LPLAT superfamily acyltransferase